jgi:putative IMPACT (imprinted ancient) family translation regulator
MEMLVKEQIVDAAVIVSRYWGGTLLGSGGLTRAYGQAASAAVHAAGLARMMPCTTIVVTIEYGHYGAVEQLLERGGYQVSGTTFTDVVSVTVFVAAGEEEIFATRVADLTAGAALVETGTTVYLAG